jgi:hypothetical protein
MFKILHTSLLSSLSRFIQHFYITVLYFQDPSQMADFEDQVNNNLQCSQPSSLGAQRQAIMALALFCIAFSVSFPNILHFSGIAVFTNQSNFISIKADYDCPLFIFNLSLLML